MNRKGFTLVEIMIVVAIIALLAAIAIPNLLRAKVLANDALARSTLRHLSTAAETYSTLHGGDYPTDTTFLTGATPPYINRPYIGETIAGFQFRAIWSTSSYLFTAEPVAGQAAAGTTTFTISTGGILRPLQ